MKDKNNNCPIPWVSKTFCEGDDLSICDVCKKAYYRGLMVGREGGYEAGFADGEKQGEEKKWEEVINNFILLKVDDLTAFVQEWREDTVDEFKMNLNMIQTKILNNWKNLKKTIGEENE